MKQPVYLYECNCGEPIEANEQFCLSCQNHYETKYGSDIAHYSIRGYEDGLIILESPKGDIKKVTQLEFKELEDKDLVWYSFRGVADMRPPKKQ